MKQFWITNILLLLCTVLFAQTATISGRVQLTDGTPVSTATIQVEGSQLISSSDDEGFYTLEGVPYGKHTIIVSSIEIISKRTPLEVNKPTYELPISVDPRGDIKLNEVRVTRNTVKREIETQGFAVNVIETKEVAARNIQTNELLDRTVGVRVRKSGGLGSEVEYNLNGMTGRSVGIFIDGIEMSTYGSSFNLSNIPPSMIERIEVYKGVLPSHLTGDLLGGAINIVLKKGKNTTNSLSASVSYGSFNTTQSDISALYRHAKSGFTTRIAGSLLNTDNDYEIWGKFSKYIEPNGVVQRNYRTKRFFDGYRSLAGRFEFGYTDVKWADDFLLGYHISDSYNEIQHGQTMGTPYMGRTVEAQANVLSLTYNKKDLITPGLDLAVNGVYSFRNTHVLDTVAWAYNWDGKIRLDMNGNPIRKLDGGQQGDPVMADIDRQVANVRSNLSYDIISGHRLSLNHVFYTVDRKDYDLLKPRNDLGFDSSNDLAKNVLSFNYEAQTFDNRLVTNVFYKLYQQSTVRTTYIASSDNGQTTVQKNETKDNRTHDGYGLAASYRIRPTVIFMASAERAVRMPVDRETFGSPEDNVLANPGITPEISDNINLGFRLGSFHFDDHRISLGTNVFWRNVKDRIMPRANELLNNQEIELTQYVNLGLAQSLGFEGELNYIYKNNLTVMFNFSKFNSLFKQEFDPATGQRMTYYNKQIPNEPFFTMNGNVQYRLDDLIQKNSQLNMFYSLGFVAPFRTVWPESEWFVTPTQLAQNVGFSYTFPSRRIIASVDVKNMFNAEVYDNFGVQKPGRAVFLKLNYSINKF